MDRNGHPPDGERGHNVLVGSVSDLRLVAGGMSQLWPISPEMRRKCLERAMRVVEDDEASTYHVLAAVKVIALADCLNARRERNTVQEHGQSLQADASLLSAAPSSPES